MERFEGAFLLWLRVKGWGWKDFGGGLWPPGVKGWRWRIFRRPSAAGCEGMGMEDCSAPAARCGWMGMADFSRLDVHAEVGIE